MEFVIEGVEPLGNITARPMFGGYTIYCDDSAFGLVARDALYLKADEQNRPEFEARALPAFRPFEDQNSVMQYYVAPAEMFEDPDDQSLRGGHGILLQTAADSDGSIPKGSAQGWIGVVPEPT